MPPRRKLPTTTPSDIPTVLVEAALADLKYLEPKRTRDRVISCLNELFWRVQRLERLHEHTSENAPQPERQ